MKKTETPNSKISSSMKILKWVGLAIILVVVFIGLQTYRQAKMIEERRAIMEEQRQVLVNGWKAQGMTDEEIQQKLQSQRPVRSGDHQTQRGFSIMRLFGGGRPLGGGR